MATYQTEREQLTTRNNEKIRIEELNMATGTERKTTGITAVVLGASGSSGKVGNAQRYASNGEIGEGMRRQGSRKERETGGRERERKRKKWETGRMRERERE
eukprot:987077-Amorphochlora_amoeboformis.AAC.2